MGAPLQLGMSAPGAGCPPHACCEQNDRQTGVKTLSGRNYVAHGNNHAHTSSYGCFTFRSALNKGLTKVSDQSRALEDRNDSNNSSEVCTPNSFIHLFYNSPDMDVVDMHNILIIPSDSVLWNQTEYNALESRIRLCPLSPHQVMVGTLDNGGNPGIKDSLYPLSPHQVMVGTLSYG